MDQAVVPAVYDELRQLAAAKLANEYRGQTLDPTALVHEAWLRLVSQSVEWQDRTHFFRLAATAMRRILIDRARAKLARKRGQQATQVSIANWAGPIEEPALLALDEALTRLATIKPEHARLVEIRFFAGLTGDQAAEVLGISPSTADRMWRYARAWLQVELS